MLPFHSLKIENVTPPKHSTKAFLENVTKPNDRNSLKNKPLQNDDVKKPPLVTFRANTTKTKKSSFCNIFDEKKVLHSLVLLQKCAIFANRQLAYGLGEIRKPRNSFASLL